jgi:acylphosphatase
MDGVVRWLCVATGRVQGVNYRARVAEAARRHDVFGTVENRPDGTVFIDVQGGRERIVAFLEDVRGSRGESRADSVRKVAEAPVQEDRVGFEIRRG